MSDLATKPRPKLERSKRVELSEWKGVVFQEKGWQSKLPAQRALHGDMRAACVAVDRSTLQAGVGENCSAAIAQEKLKPGTEFKRFQAALSYFEQAPPDRRPSLAGELRIAAEGYIAHYDGHTKSAKSDKTSIRKKAICEETLKDLRRIDLSSEMKQLPPPPWNSEVAMQAASLRATLDFESLPAGQRAAEELGGAHVYPAYWVNKAAGDDKEKTFLFKPVPGGKDADGNDKGWKETAREALAGRLGDVLSGMTEMDFGVPETHVVAIGTERFPEDMLTSGKVAVPRRSPPASSL